MIKELHKQIVNQIQHHEFLYDGAWGDISIKVLDHELTDAINFLKSRNWNVAEVYSGLIIIRYKEGSNTKLYD